MRKHSGKSNLPERSQMIPPIVQRDPVPRSDTTAPPSTLPKQWRGNKIEKTFSLSIVSHITIRPVVELSRKRISLLLEQEIVRVASQGFSLEDYFVFEWLLNYLIGSQSIHNINKKKMSTVVYCANIILLSYRDNWNFFYRKTEIRQELRNLIDEIFGKYSDRKYQGRDPIFQIDKFLQVRIEDVETITERSQNSIRYSSYCKGYGEGGRSVRRQSTRYSYELDRDDHENEIPEEFFSFGKSIHEQEDLFYLEQLIRRERKA